MPQPKKQPQWRVLYTDPNTNMNGVGFIDADTEETAKEQYERKHQVNVTDVLLARSLEGIYTY